LKKKEKNWPKKWGGHGRPGRCDSVAFVRNCLYLGFNTHAFSCLKNYQAEHELSYLYPGRVGSRRYEFLQLNIHSLVEQTLEVRRLCRDDALVLSPGEKLTAVSLQAQYIEALDRLGMLMNVPGFRHVSFRHAGFRVLTCRFFAGLSSFAFFFWPREFSNDGRARDAFRDCLHAEPNSEYSTSFTPQLHTDTFFIQAWENPKSLLKTLCRQRKAGWG